MHGAIVMEDLTTLKLDIIQRIVVSRDATLLNTIQQLLRLDEWSAASPTPGNPTPSSPNDLAELQQSISAVFDPNAVGGEE